MMKKSHSAIFLTVLIILIGGATISGAFRAKAALEAGQAHVVIVSAATFKRTDIAPGSIVAAFGQGLANTTASATDTDPNRPGIQLPTLLGGVRIKVQGRNAGLLYVSPDQINFVVPEDLDLFNVPNPSQPEVLVEIIPSGGPILTTAIAIKPVSPAIFTVDSSGGGLPAGYIVRVSPVGPIDREVIEPLFRLGENGAIIPIPVDLCRQPQQRERVFLVFFLTGINRASDPNFDGNANESVRVIANGYSLKPAFAGAQGDFVGLNQINVELPCALSGGASLKIAVTAVNEEQSNQTEIALVVKDPGAQPPVAMSKSVKTDEDTPLMIGLEASGGSGPLQYEITSGPRNGSVITSGANVTYIPNDNFNGFDEFTFRANDGRIGSKAAKVAIEVVAVNDPPKVNVVGGRVAIVGQFVPLRVDVSDPDEGQASVVTASNLPPGARFDNSSSRLVWVPNATGSYTFSFTATDNGNPPLSDTQTVTVRVADNPEKAAWSQLNTPNNLPVSVVFADGNDIYTVTFDINAPINNPFRLFKSVDQGANWMPADNGLPGPVGSIERSGAALFAITGDNIYRSTDGANWAVASGDLPRKDGRLKTTALKATADKVYVATATGIFATTDQGAHWTNITGDLPFPPPNDAVFIYPPRISSIEIAGNALFVAIRLELFFRLGPFGVWESQPPSEALAELAAGMAAEPPRYGVFRTTNNGANWVPVNNGLRNPINPIYAISVERVVANGSRLYALTSAGLFFSNNQGASWTSISSDLTNSLFDSPPFFRKEIFTLSGDNLYLSLPLFGLYLSRNNGADWLPINIGLPEGYLIGATISNSKIFAVTLSGKLYVRTAM